MFLKKIVTNRLDNDQEKLPIMAPALEENIGFCDTHQWDADTPNQTRYKGAHIFKIYSDQLRRVSMFILLNQTFQNGNRQHSYQDRHEGLHSK